VAKLSPADLAQVLSRLPRQSDENVLVGFETADDAGVLRISDDVAVVQTVDFFTPVADDPAIYGRIAAINALNDVYAMGGKPLSALSIVCFPQKGEMSLLAEILEGGQAAMAEAGVVVIGGHSVDDAEIKIGYAVTGVIHPERVVRNSGAKPGDHLILTKPIGTGAINTAVKFGKARPESVTAAIECMTTSAADASKLMVELGASSCTDITGFGLLGHAYEMAKASGVTLRINPDRVPLLPYTLELIEMGMLTRGDRNNRLYVGDNIRFSPEVSPVMQSALFDPQTAGGLLISIGKSGRDKLLAALPAAREIGTVEKMTDKLLVIE